MNLDHCKSLAGILKIVALLTCVVAACLGISGYSMSAYNKSCRNGDVYEKFRATEAPGDPRTAATSKSITVSSTSVKETVHVEDLHQATDEVPTTESTDHEKDMAPVLWMERFQISCTWMGSFISLILLVLYLVKEDWEYSKYFKAVNFTFHFIWFILLVIATIFMSYAAIEIDRQICQPSSIERSEDCQNYMTKMSASGFTLLTAFLYAVIAARIIATRLYTEV